VSETSAAVVSNNQWLLSNLKTLTNGQFGYNPMLSFLSSSLLGSGGSGGSSSNNSSNQTNLRNHNEDRFVNAATAFKLNQNKNSQTRDRKPIKRLNSGSGSNASKHFFDGNSKSKKHIDCKICFLFASIITRALAG
jgi:hypothetical protein